MTKFCYKRSICAGVIFWLGLAVAPAHVLANPWILLDAGSGRVFAHNEAMRPWHPASITKLMTAYTVFKEIAAGRIDLNSPVRITALALSMPPSKMGLPVGTILTVENAVKMIMVKSANDIATALAQSARGSLRAFVGAMNENAARLNMSATHFTNPHGLHAIDQVTTAKDMALLALALQREFPHHSRFFKIHAIKFGKIRMRNHNRLLSRFAGTNGMKTGYTCASGLNIVARAKRNGRELIAVVLGGYSGVERNILTAQLLSGGFNDRFNFEARPHVSELAVTHTQYAVPANLTAMVCRPSWSELRLTNKQRRARRKHHLAKLEKQRKIYLNARIKPTPASKVFLGNATGLNPYGYRLVKGAAPKKTPSTPIWRPDRSAPPEDQGT